MFGATGLQDLITAQRTLAPAKCQSFPPPRVAAVSSGFRLGKWLSSDQIEFVQPWAYPGLLTNAPLHIIQTLSNQDKHHEVLDERFDQDASRDLLQLLACPHAPSTGIRGASETT